MTRCTLPLGAAKSISYVETAYLEESTFCSRCTDVAERTAFALEEKVRAQ